MQNWLAVQVALAKAEIEKWPQWKRDVMRAEISNNMQTRTSNFQRIRKLFGYPTKKETQ